MAEVEFETEYGTVSVGVRRSTDEYGNQSVSRAQDLIAAGMTMADSLIIIRPLAEALMAQVQALAHRAESVEAEFGLELGAKGKFIVAEAGATASLKITLTWKP